MSEEQWEIGEEQVRDCKAVAMVFDIELAGEKKKTRIGYKGTFKKVDFLSEDDHVVIHIPDIGVFQFQPFTFIMPIA